jgi:hypothetical protein
MELHHLPIFYTYVVWAGASALFVVHVILVLQDNGTDQPFTPSNTAFLFVIDMLWTIGFGVFAPLDYLDQTAETVHSFDILSVDRWRWRARFLLLGIVSPLIVGGFSATIVLISSVELKAREQGAMVIWLTTLGVSLLTGGLAAFSKRELLAVRAQLGAATRVKLDTGLRIQHFVLIASAFVVILSTCFAAIESARNTTGAAFTLVLLPLMAFTQCYTVSVRLKNAQRQFFAAGLSTTVERSKRGRIPTGGKSAAILDLSVLSTAIENRNAQIQAQAHAPKPTVPVARAGVSLALLRQLAAEHGIDSSSSMTMYSFCERHIKPHTKNIGGKGSGAFVELVSGGGSTDGLARSWCGQPSHMLSYRSGPTRTHTLLS